MLCKDDFACHILRRWIGVRQRLQLIRPALSVPRLFALLRLLATSLRSIIASLFCGDNTTHKLWARMGRHAFCFAFLSLLSGTLFAGTAGTATYSYDPLGRLVKATFPDGTQSVYSYDAAGNRTSIDLGATVPPPSVPMGLTATSPNSNTVNLSWTASTDTGGPGISGYRVLRCTGLTSPCGTFALIATASTTTYSDTTVSASTSYTYVVAALDKSNNESSPSAAAEVTTTATTAGTFQFVSGSHTAPGNSGDIATATIKNSGTGTITGISYSCGGGSWHNYGSPPTSLAVGASGSFTCQAAASGSYTVTFTLSGTNASNSPFTTPSF
jgi:YD repeat-containing protein